MKGHHQSKAHRNHQRNGLTMGFICPLQNLRLKKIQATQQVIVALLANQEKG